MNAIFRFGPPCAPPSVLKTNNLTSPELWSSLQDVFVKTRFKAVCDANGWAVIDGPPRPKEESLQVPCLEELRLFFKGSTFVVLPRANKSGAGFTWVAYVDPRASGFYGRSPNQDPLFYEYMADLEARGIRLPGWRLTAEGEILGDIAAAEPMAGSRDAATACSGDSLDSWGLPVLRPGNFGGAGGFGVTALEIYADSEQDCLGRVLVELRKRNWVWNP